MFKAGIVPSVLVRPIFLAKGRGYRIAQERPERRDRSDRYLRVLIELNDMMILLILMENQKENDLKTKVNVFNG